MQISIISSFCENKTNLCSQFTHVFCTFAQEIKKEIYIISSRLFRFLI
ncbi:hypothetical protein PREVCOP_05744 [Segatella copri DSM 18205]|uniref:Uncharacterized protein n=1 Tax=Segatella copri DSM 18205 TaxID=537011 RepID=D1PET8_9BACT|nr:hypothetical protein PREVCOP_05744 [Segatella copri DSM 18205]